MDRPNLKVIRPIQRKPSSVLKQILYPQYIAEVDIQIPRALGKPRRFKVFLLADGCTGKVVRCDGWPNINRENSPQETVSPRVNMENATTNMIDFASRKIARKYQSYWKPQIEVEHLKLVYKIFWMIDTNCAIDSLTAKKLEFS